MHVTGSVIVFYEKTSLPEIKSWLIVKPAFDFENDLIKNI